MRRTSPLNWASPLRWLRAGLAVAVATGLAACGSDDAVTPDASADTGTPDAAADAAEGDLVEDTGPVVDPGPPLSTNAYWKWIDVSESGPWYAISRFGEGDGRRYLLGGANMAVVMYDGRRHQAVPRNMPMPDDGVVDIRAVWALDEDTMIAGGDRGYLRQWNAGTGGWDQPSGLPVNTTADYVALAGISGAAVYLGSDEGDLYRYDGATWSAVLDADAKNPTGGAKVWAIEVAPDGTVFVATEAGVVWGQGSGWQSFAWNGKPVRSLWAFAADEVYAAAGSGGTGQSRVARYDGTSWVEETTPAPAIQGLRAIWGSDAGNVFAGGLNGTFMRRYDAGAGAKWTMVTGSEPYLIEAPAGTPDGEKIDGKALTFVAMSGMASDDILVATSGDASGRSLIYYRHHPIFE